MKTLLTALLLCFGVMQTAYGLAIEVAPLKLKANVEAFGVHLGVDGKKAIVFAGETAKDIANMAGVTFKKSKQVIIISGKEVNKLLKHSVKLAGKTGKTTIIMTGDILDAAYDLTKDALRVGKKVVIKTYKKGKSYGSFIVKGLYKLGKAPIILITDAGIEIVQFAGKILSLPLKIVCSTFKLFKIPVACTAL